MLTINVGILIKMQKDIRDIKRMTIESYCFKCEENGYDCGEFEECDVKRMKKEYEEE
jgi:hypothetical protein